MEKLSPREKQVAELILEGFSDRGMAERLGLSTHTINSYTKSLFKKVGIHKRSALGRAALEALRSEQPPQETKE